MRDRDAHVSTPGFCPSSSDESILLSQFEDLAKAASTLGFVCLQALLMLFQAGVDSAMCSWWGRKAFVQTKSGAVLSALCNGGLDRQAR